MQSAQGNSSQSKAGGDTLDNKENANINSILGRSISVLIRRNKSLRNQQALSRKQTEARNEDEELDSSLIITEREPI